MGIRVVVNQDAECRDALEADSGKAASSQGKLVPLLLNVTDVAALLRVSVSTVWRMKKKAEIPDPVAFPGKAKRWSRQDILEWVEMGCPNRVDFEKLKN